MFHEFQMLHARLDELLAVANRIERRIVLMSGTQDSFDAEIASLTQAVADTDGAEASAETALAAIPSMIEAAIQLDRQQTGSAAQLTSLAALVAKLRAGAPTLAAAVAAAPPGASSSPAPSGTAPAGDQTAGDTTSGATSGAASGGASAGDTVTGAGGADPAGGVATVAGTPTDTTTGPTTGATVADTPADGATDPAIGTASGGPATVSGGASS